MSACRSLERPLTVAFLGPVGTFSEMAMHRQFGTSVTGLPCATLDEVFRATEAGSADVGIVPLENSTEGAVSRTLDLLLATPLKLMAELSLTVNHNLLTRTGAMDGVQTHLCALAGAGAMRGMAGAALPVDRAARGGQQCRRCTAGGRGSDGRRGRRRSGGGALPVERGGDPYPGRSEQPYALCSARSAGDPAVSAARDATRRR